MKSPKQKTKREPRPHARCTCGWRWPKKDQVHASLLGYPVTCGQSGCDRIAYVIRYEDETFWISTRNFLLNFETKWALTRIIHWPKGREETFVYFMTAFVLSIPFYLSQFPMWLQGLLLVFLIYRVLEIILYNVSVAFVSRWHRDLLRSFFLWLLNYVQVVVAFGCFYWPFAKCFRRELHSVLDSVYFSLVTITTLGYGEIFPISRWPKILTGLELISGFILVAAVLNLLIGSTSTIPRMKEAWTTEKLATKSANLGKEVQESLEESE